MNESTPTTPSLFALTAPKESGRREAAPADGFADELSAASSTKPEPNREASASTTAESKSSRNRAEADRTTAETPTDTTQSEEATTDESTDTTASEAALLSVTIATETVVAETSLDATLPEEAATTLDVVAEAAAPSGAIEGQSTTQEGQETSTITLAFAGLEAEAGEQQTAIGSATVPDSADNEASRLAAAGLLVDETTIEPEATETAASEVPIEATVIAGDLEQDASDGEAPSAPDASDTETAAEAARAADLAGESETDSPIVETSEDQSAAEGDEIDHRPSTPVNAVPAAAETQPAPTADTTSTTETSGREPTVGSTDSTPGTNNDRAGVDRTEPIASRPSVDASRFVSRVSGAINSANERGGPIEIRLSPPELGALRVSIEVKEGVLTAQLEAETPAARATLLDNLPALRDRLEQQQIRIEKFDVDVRDESNQRGDDWQPPERDGQSSDERADRQRPRAPATVPREAPISTVDPAAPRTITFDDNGINLVA